MENLFWKVIRNIYLFKKIFYHIDNDEISKDYIGFRIKFKLIKSLEFLVIHKQWSLLKDKLQSNQYLLIDKRAIKMFLQECQDIDLIRLLYQKKRNHIEIVDLIATSIKVKNLLAFDLFFNHLKLPIYTKLKNKSLKYATKKIKQNQLLSFQFLNIIINNQLYNKNNNNNNNNNNN